MRADSCAGFEDNDIVVYQDGRVSVSVRYMKNRKEIVAQPGLIEIAAPKSMTIEALRSTEGRHALADARAEAEARAEEDPAAARSCILALARALGHNHEADDAGNMRLDDNIVRKLGSWRKALRGAGPEDLAWYMTYKLHSQKDHKLPYRCMEIF